MAPTLVISIGDINGIGPEVILKSLLDHDYSSSVPVILSPFEVIGYYSDTLGISLDLNYVNSYDDISLGRINVLWDEAFSEEIEPGSLTVTSGTVAMKSIEKCVALVQNGDAQAMVTGPISKESVNLAGYYIPGHTEFLAEQTGVDEVLMMLVNENLRVALVTAHVPISEVSSIISAVLINQKAQLLNHSLKFDFGIPEPKIALLGLNPHAGDGGVIGREEIDVVEPAIQHAREIGINLEGPYPADGFFGHQLHNQYDAILAMYHDQGLAPFKLLSFGKGVNFTAGLPIIRTSPDHGTAFNIAGKNLANPSSFKQAYQLAINLFNNDMVPSSTPIYTKLAELYDTLMGDVDYESWADYIDEIMQTHYNDPNEVMEVACGTGSVILSLAELECYRLTGTDLSPAMTEIAKKKAIQIDAKVHFEPSSFSNLDFKNQFDCVYAVFDSINYLHKENEVIEALNSIHRTLKKDGLFIFDFSTPKNSLESVDHLNEAEGEYGNLRFFRKSWYKHDEKVHYNEFEIDELDPTTKKIIRTWTEMHQQRAYTLPEMLSILEQTPYHLVAKYDGFDLIEADENSARVTIVLRCQKTQ